MAFDAVAKILIPLQHKLFYIIMGLARFNLYANSYVFLAKTALQPSRAKGGRWWWWAEIICIGFFYSWYLRVLKGCGSWPVALGYLLISNVVPSPLHVQVSYLCFRSKLYIANQKRTDRAVALLSLDCRLRC